MTNSEVETFNYWFVSINKMKLPFLLLKKYGKGTVPEIISELFILSDQTYHRKWVTHYSYFISSNILIIWWTMIRWYSPNSKLSQNQLDQYDNVAVNSDLTFTCNVEVELPTKETLTKTVTIDHVTVNLPATIVRVVQTDTLTLEVGLIYHFRVSWFTGLWNHLERLVFTVINIKLRSWWYSGLL